MDLTKQIIKGDKSAITRAISLVENNLDNARKILDKLSPHIGKAIRIGVTGPPGVGKSTLVDRMTSLFRQRKHRVGVIAVDPSSPFTGGALLGDRVRMAAIADDPDLFIRSMATRGKSGGLSRAASDAADVLDASGRDVLLIETAGVGQTDVDIAQNTDCVLVVFSPESGDEIQAMKAGIMEIADIIVINKADRGGADKFEVEIRNAIQMRTREHVDIPIVLTKAYQGEGVDKLVDQILNFIEQGRQSGEFYKRRLINTQERIRALVELLVQKQLWNGTGSGKILHDMAQSVEDRKVSPYQAAGKIVNAKKGKAR